MLRHACLVLCLVGAGGCFKNFKGGDGGSSSGGTTGEPVLPPVDLFALACDNRTMWQSGTLEDLSPRTCDQVLPPPGLGGVRTHEQLVVQDMNTASKVIEVIAFASIGGVTQGRISQVSISAFEDPVVATEIACRSEAPGCEFSWEIRIYDPDVPAVPPLTTENGVHDAEQSIDTHRLPLGEISIDLVDVEIATLSSGDDDPDDHALFIELRIEEAP